MSHYCKKCKKPVMASGGGTYCRFHQQELCHVLEPHCHSCGVSLVKRVSIAWCPDCNDSLETKEVWRPDKEFGKIIDHFEYYCFGCDKTFVLVDKVK